MRSLSIVLVAALAAAPLAASAQRGGGHPNQGRGFNLSHDAPTTGSYNGRNGAGGYNKNTGNAATYNKNTGTATTYNKNTNSVNQYQKNPNTSTAYHNNNKNGGAYNGSNSAGAYNKNTGNAAVYNKNTGNMTVYNKNTNSSSTYRYNSSGQNSYYYGGRVVVNPVYVGPAWGWNRGVAWAPVGSYWGGGFWGPFAVGAASAALMGNVMYQNQNYSSYAVSSGSPGATLLSNYGLQQTTCGPPNLVVIYGPNFGVICAFPNNLVSAGSYAVNTNNLTLQSQ
jgi:hypothetical protein